MGNSNSHTGANSTSDNARVDVEFRGRVQGVGFRATTAVVISQYPLYGYVMNLRSGGVRLVAEGSRTVVSKAGNDTL